MRWFVATGASEIRMHTQAMPRGKEVEDCQLSPGWWILPVVLGGAACWVWIGLALVRVFAG